MVTLLSIATMEMLRLPLPLSCAFALNSALDTSVCFLFLGDQRPKACPQSRILVSRCDPLPALFRGDRRLSQLPWRPRCPFAVLFDPGRTSTPDPCSASVLPPLSQARRLPRSSLFRGSFTRLCGSLPTLEGVVSESPTKARFRWRVSPFRAGRLPPGLDRGFLLLVLSTAPFGFIVSGLSAVPASQGFGWRQVIRSGWGRSLCSERRALRACRARPSTCPQPRGTRLSATHACFRRKIVVAIPQIRRHFLRSWFGA
jgi:hypothetical protein